ncbi:MAG: DUF1254 domain-containing protein [Rhizobiaceae bacterium]|nr:DUF1254 domain-containing protein [Rhizobiaceae bacterium]MCV0405510.1 DUF1254 domain-containing protein [Rhizobiaceae bacterium]
MRSLAYALLLGLVGAAIVHIAVLLMVPAYSERDAWSKLAAAAGPYSIVRVSGDETVEPLVSGIDPLFEAAACRFDLSEAPARLAGRETVPFWSVSVYDRAGVNLYSFNDRTADQGLLDLLIVTPAQMLELRKELPAEYERSVIVETEATEGIVVVRAFRPDAEWRAEVLRFLEGVTCRPA